MKHINIMTSCNDGIAQYILPQIASIGVNLSNYQVEFYLLHSRIAPEKINLIREYSKTFANIGFNEVVVKDLEPYKKIAKQSGDWPYEAFFSLCCHDYLPKSMERILYIDAADIIIDGDVAEYYFGDFEGNSIIATPLKYTDNGLGEHRIFNKNDLDDVERLAHIRAGIFNSGAFVINVAKFRACKLTMDDFIHVSNVINNLCTKSDGKMVYTGDQGLLSITFVGDIKFFAYPEIKNVYYMPYNFCVFAFESLNELWYTPKIIHYAGTPMYKPWNARFSVDEVDKYKFKTDFVGNKAPFFMRGKQIEFFEIWWKYCEMTPIYEELNRDARIFAQALEAYYLPLCKRYNDLVDSHSQREEG